MAFDGIYHWRLGDWILYRWLPIADNGAPYATFDNADKIIPELAEGIWIDGWFYPPPPRASELLRALPPRVEPDPQQFKREHGDDLTEDDPGILAYCDLYRAAILEPAPPRR